MLNNRNIETRSFKEMLKSEAKGASIYTLSTFLLRFGSFLIVPLFWKKLSVSDYGIIAIVEIIGTFLGMFLSLQLEMSITRFYYEWAEDKRKQNVGSLWLLSWISIILLGILSIYILSIISNLLFKDVPFYPFIYLGLIYFIIGKLATIPFATIRIINKPILYATYSILDFSIRMLLSIYFVLILNKQLTGLFISNIIANSVVAVIGIVIMLRFAKPSIKINTLKESLKFSLPLIPGSTLSGVTKFLDQYLLQTYASIEVLGIYNISLKFTNLVIQLHSALKTSFIPFMIKVISNDKERGVNILSKMRLFYLAPLFILSVAISFYIRDFVYFINRPEYFPVAKWVPLLVIPALISTFTIYLAPGLLLSKRTGLSWIPTLSQLIVVLIFGITLIPKMQLLGVIISRYASVLGLFFVKYYISDKLYKIPISWLKLTLLLGFTIFFIYVSKIIEIQNPFLSIGFHTFMLLCFSILTILIVVGRKKLISRTIFVTVQKDHEN